MVKEILADSETPVSAYMKIMAGNYSFLLESVEGNARIGRFSFLGSSPRWIFTSKRNEITLQEGEKIKRWTSTNALEELKKLFQDFRIVEDQGLPNFFGGAVGYVGYGAVEQFDRIPQNKKDDLDVPDLCFILADALIAFDHVEHRLKLIANAFIGKDGPEAAYRKAIARIRKMEKALSRARRLPAIEWNDSKEYIKQLKVKSNFTKSEFEGIVEKSKEYIRAGDIFQVVLSQRFSVDLNVNALTLYRVLRSINPSPYMFLLRFKGFDLVGTSPEILVRSEKGRVEVRPIAGTRPRGKTVEEDLQLEQSLLSDPKERAEHLMLVDLGRNDVGHVCTHGSVHVPEFMVVERYSHVMHIVSDVVGALAAGKDAFDVLKAAFPAGTVTGAPKIRAMQIIEELEKHHRGSYAGAIGYYSFSGNLDSCITIRTILLKDGKAYVQAGAGIVADSVPAQEYQETVNKSKAMMKAIALAQAFSKKGKKSC